MLLSCPIRQDYQQTEEFKSKMVMTMISFEESRQMRGLHVNVTVLFYSFLKKLPVKVNETLSKY